MKRSAAQRGSATGTTLPQLEDLPLRLIALKCSNPGPLAASCKAAHRSISTGGDFEVEWFLRWVHVLAPLRPWQYAAICWQRLGGAAATAEQLCNFILRVSEARCHQGQHLCPYPNPTESVPGQGSRSQNAAQQQQQQQQGNPEAGITSQPVQPKSRSGFSTMPYFVPRPSLIRHARRLLSRDTAVHALCALCPGESWVIYQYAAAAGNVKLLQQLIAAMPASMPSLYPWCSLVVSAGSSRMLNVGQLCAHTAMRAGHVSVLEAVLLNAGSSIKERPYQVWQLFRFACRHSNAACLQLLLEFAPCDEYHGNRKLQPWPQHLTMAAARVDPWAAGVVSLLLRVMSPKLLAAKFMVPAYTAACKSGHMPVLQQLLQVAAAAPAKHLPVLLKAAAVAANPSTWQLLLSEQLDLAEAGGSTGAGTSSSGGRDSGRSGSGPTSTSEPGAVAAAGANTGMQPSTSRVTGGGGRLFSFISSWFAHQPAEHVGQSASWQQQQQDAQQEVQVMQPATAQREGGATSHYITRQQWQLLQAADWSAALLALLDDMCVTCWRPSQGPSKMRVAADQDRVAMADQLWQLLDSMGSQSEVCSYMQEQFSKDVSPWASFGAMQQLLFEAPASKVAWLLQHQLLPTLPPDWQPSPHAAIGVRSMVTFGFRHGLRQTARSLWQLAQQLHMEGIVAPVVEACLDGALQQAAATHDMAAVQQLAAFAGYQAELMAVSGSSSGYTCSSILMSASSCLLTALTCAWNAAVVLDGKGFVQRVGLPLQQHLRLCAAASVPGLLEAITVLDAADVVRLFDVICCGQQAPNLSTAMLQSIQQLQEAVDGLSPEVCVKQCLQQLSGEWARWQSGKPLRLVLPTSRGLETLDVDVLLGWLQSDGAGLGLLGNLDGLQRMMRPLPLQVTPADVAGFESCCACALSEPASKSQPAAAATAMTTASTPESPRTLTVSAGSGYHVPLDAGLRMSLIFAHAQAGSRAGTCKPLTLAAAATAPATGQTGVLPLWQLAAMAIVCPGSQHSPSTLRATADMVLQGLLAPAVQEPATPAFLLGATSNSAGDVVPSAGPMWPPEHEVLQSIMSGKLRLYPHCCWYTIMHRLDALAWALHPQQEALWKLPEERETAGFYLQDCTTGIMGSVPRRDSLLTQQHERHLRQLQQQRAAGVTEGFGALPHFAAAAADAATTMLALSQSVRLNNLVRLVGGNSSAAMLEYVKGMVAAVLAAPSKQLQAIRDGGWLSVDVSSVRKVVEAGDADLLTLLTLHDLRAASLQPKPAE